MILKDGSETRPTEMIKLDFSEGKQRVGKLSGVPYENGTLTISDLFKTSLSNQNHSEKLLEIVRLARRSHLLLNANSRNKTQATGPNRGRRKLFESGDLSLNQTLSKSYIDTQILTTRTQQGPEGLDGKTHWGLGENLSQPR